MAGNYVSAPVEVDPTALQELAYDYLRARIPGWEPAAGNLDVWLIEAFALIAAQVAEVASDVPTSIFRYYGANIVEIAPREATPATGAVTIVARDTNGYHLAAGTIFGLQVEGTWLAFEVTSDHDLAAGVTTLAAVPMVAVEAGAAGTGLTGGLVPLDALDWVLSASFDDATSGGVDAESDEDYLARLVEELRLLSPRPILPEDFAVLAKRITEVDRALALDGYDPTDNTYGNQRMVSLALASSSGEAVSQDGKDAVKALLEDAREVNFEVSIIDPSYTNVSVNFAVECWPDFDAAAVVANAEAALEAYLSPATWGQPDYGDVRQWVNEPKVRYLEVAQVLNSVEGVRYVETLTVNGLTNTNVTLIGPAPLPNVGTITGAAV